MDIAVQQAVRDSVIQASPAVHHVADLANWWGGTGIVLFAALLWLGGRAAKWMPVARAGLRGAEGLAVASAASGIIKGLTGRARPFVTPAEPWHWLFNRGWSEAQFFSMPSGHTTATAAFAMGVLMASRGWPTRARAAMVLPLLASAAVVGFARMYADQHWLTDVLAGAMLGMATSAVLARIHAKSPGSRYDRVMLGSSAATNDPA